MSDQRTVLVTGSASGIGHAVLTAFADLGCHVVGVDRSPTPGSAASIVGDVRDASVHRQAVDAALDATGRLDVLVANAGVHDGGLGLDTDPAELAKTTQDVVAVNVLGSVLAIQASHEALRRTRGCVVVTLSDAAFLAGQTGAGIPYTASKYALLGVTRWAARALAPEIRVNAVAPGGVITGLGSADADAKRAAVKGRNALGTILELDELARMYVFLASPHARGMTGEVLRLDGGLGLG